MIIAILLFVIMTGKMYFAVLLALMNYSVLKIALCKNVELDKSKTTVDIQFYYTIESSSATRTVKKGPVQHKRFRRATNSEHREQCKTALQCTGNYTLFEKTDDYYNCYCDNACYETFKDCCPDFVKTCGAQKKTNTKNSQRLWKCLAVGDWNAHYQNVDTYCRLNGPSGIWMIANCSRNWALDETKTRCENAPDKFSFPVEDFLPVVGKNRFTYRNKHCAECNKETSYQSWDIVLEGPVTPPKEYNLDDRLRFVSENREKIRPTKPGKHMPRRYCAGARYADSCPNTSHPAYQECLNGPVETVGGSNRGYFKNEACTLCNEKTTISEERTWLVCSADSATEIFLRWS